MKLGYWAGALVATFLVAGCEDMPRVPQSAEDTTQRFASIEGDYRIGVDDRVQVAVWRNPELSVIAPVGRTEKPQCRSSVMSRPAVARPARSLKPSRSGFPNMFAIPMSRSS